MQVCVRGHGGHHKNCAAGPCPRFIPLSFSESHVYNQKMLYVLDLTKIFKKLHNILKPCK